MKLGLVELEMLHLGASLGREFDEKDIEKSNLKKYGVGRILDTLASLKENNLIKTDSNGKFAVTNLALQLLWDIKMPLWLRILHLLEIKSFDEQKISNYLCSSQDKIGIELENLRKNGLIMMTTIRTDSGIDKVFELLPDGHEQLEKAAAIGYDNVKISSDTKDSEILKILHEIEVMINQEPNLEQSKKDSLIAKLKSLKENLGI